VSPLCSRNARSQKTLVGPRSGGIIRATLGINIHEQAWKAQRRSLAAALPWNGASWRAGVGRVRSLAFLSILRSFSCYP
jgi:hypothetical protein